MYSSVDPGNRPNVNYMNIPYMECFGSYLTILFSSIPVASSNKKLVETSATLVVTGALLVVPRSSWGASEVPSQEATRNKCHATSNKCLTSSSKKLLVH